MIALPIVLQHDDQLVKEYGIKRAVDMIQRLTKNGEVPGVHFCTLNLEKSVHRVLESLGWAGGAPSQQNKLISAETGSEGLQVTPGSATSTAKRGLASIPATSQELGSGELNHAATWDEFPNGRFGDFKSPAFGSQDAWGNSTVVVRHLLLIFHCFEHTNRQLVD